MSRLAPRFDPPIKPWFNARVRFSDRGGRDLFSKNFDAVDDAVRRGDAFLLDPAIGFSEQAIGCVFIRTEFEDALAESTGGGLQKHRQSRQRAPTRDRGACGWCLHTAALDQACLCQLAVADAVAIAAIDDVP